MLYVVKRLMIKTLYILSISAVICLSCALEKKGTQEDRGGFVASFEKISPSFQFSWKEGDEISINGYIYRTEQGGREAVFLPVAEPVPQSSEYFAVFPAETRTEGMKVKGVIPRTVALDGEGTLSEEYRVSMAKSSSRSLVFHNLFSFVSVDIMSDDIDRLEFASNGSELLCGNFTIDCSENNPITYADIGFNSVSVEKTDGSTFSRGSKLYFVTLPCTLKSGYTVSVSPSIEDNRKWSTSVDEHTALLRGKSLELGEIYYDAKTGSGRLDAGDDINVPIDFNRKSENPVSELIFGSFSEMHGGDLIPGICEQYVVNPSFEQWISSGDKGESKNELVFTGNDAITEDPNVAYPWEKRAIRGESTFARSKVECYNTSASQEITLEYDGVAALLQRMALPLYRTSSYKVRFYAKSSGNVSLKLSFRHVDLGEESVLSDVYSPVISSGGWQEYEHEFVLISSSAMFNNRHSQCNLWFEFSGTGTVYIDQVTLFPSDCVEGIFNPETIEYFKKYGVRAIRWPGGNYTSGYNWKNGIGSWDERPCLKNKAWGGLDPNYLGTDEFLRFCELTDIEPIMGVGYNKSVLSEQDIADWVEYCNGPASSGYGSIRAANGHPEPYDVKYWGIGNEVYGSYQLGNADVDEYSAGLASMSLKMKTIDADIHILASGRGVHNHYRNRYPGWTETLALSDSYDILDCHLYVYGNDSSNPMNLSGEDFFRIFAAADMNLKDFLDDMRRVVPGKKIAFLEWGVLPKLSGNTYNTPQRQTFANMLISACIYHEMIRNSDIVEMAAMHNFSFYVAPHKLHSEPVNMRTDLIKEMSALSGGFYIPVDEKIFPEYDQNIDFMDVGVREGVSEIDMAVVHKDDCIYVSCVNRSPSEEYKLALSVLGASGENVGGRTYTCSRPYERSLWSDVIQAKVSDADIDSDNLVTLPPLSYSMLILTLKNY